MSTTNQHASDSLIENPIQDGASGKYFVSDLVAETMRDLGIDYIALNPGSSFRGLHDSLVNHLGNRNPQMLLCLHEEHAVAIAHGYAKVTGRPMGVAVHANVGLMHATMAMFNAWCDRMPMLVFGATGPVDANRRRPWIDWLHTARDQASMVRHYVKWDDQPSSAAAARESMLRAFWLSSTVPMAPTFLTFDTELLEQELPARLPDVDIRRYTPRIASQAHADQIDTIISRLRDAKNPLLLLGRVSRSETGWDERVALAERLNLKVITHLKLGAAFPTAHPLHVGAPSTFLSEEGRAAVREADVLLSLDWPDLAGALRQAGPEAQPEIIHVSLDHALHNGWSMDHQALPPVDHMIAADPDDIVPQLLKAAGPADQSSAKSESRTAPQAPTSGQITVPFMGMALREAVGARPTSLLHLPVSWDASTWHFEQPLDSLGGDGGGGIGGGMGIAVGAALALRGSGRLPLAIIGDGAFLMGVTALWTATHYRVPMLMVVANNQSYFNDEIHQEKVAALRGRPKENRWIGQRIADPDPDIAGFARAQGAIGIGPLKTMEELPEAFEKAIRLVEEGAVVVLDVRVAPGYTPAMTSALVQSVQ